MKVEMLKKFIKFVALTAETTSIETVQAESTS